MRVPIIVLVLLVAGLLLFGVGVIAAIGLVITALEAAAILAAVGIFIVGVALVIDFFRPGRAACGLVSRAVFRDTATPPARPARFARSSPRDLTAPVFLGLAPQAASCACVPAGAPGGGAPGGGGPAPGSEDDDDG